MIYKYYLKALMVDMVKHPLAVFSDNHTDIMVPGTYGEDFNLHRIEYIKSIQEYCDTMELGIDVQQFPVSLVNILYKFEYPVAKDGYVKETGVLCNSFLVTLKSYCDNMKYYYEYLFVCRLIQMVIDLDKETYDTIGKESYLYDSILNLIWLLEAIYNCIFSLLCQSLCCLENARPPALRYLCTDAVYPYCILNSSTHCLVCHAVSRLNHSTN